MKKLVGLVTALSAVVVLSGCNTAHKPTYSIHIEQNIVVPNVDNYLATEECILYTQGYKTVNREYCGSYEVVSLYGLPIKNRVSEYRYYNGREYEGRGR